MMRRLGLVGLATVLLGFVTLVDRGVAGFFNFGTLFVSGVGVLAIVFGARYAYGARSTTRETVDVDPPEPRYRSAVLGEDVEVALRAGGRVGTARRAGLRRHLQDVAVDVLVVHGGTGHEAAVRAVDDGTWTDDPVAAGYLADPEALPRRWQARRLLRRRSTERALVERTVDALEEVRGP